MPHATTKTWSRQIDRQFFKKLFKCKGVFPGGPVASDPPSSVGGVGSVPDQGPKIPHDSRPKNQNKNRSNVVTNSIKTSKLVHIKKKILKKKGKGKEGKRTFLKKTYKNV